MASGLGAQSRPGPGPVSPTLAPATVGSSPLPTLLSCWAVTVAIISCGGEAATQKTTHGAIGKRFTLPASRMMASRQQQHASRSNPKRSGRAVSTDSSTPSRQARRTAALALVLALAAAGWAVTAAAAADPAGTTLGSLGLLDDDDGASRPAFVDEPPPVAIGGALGGKPVGSAESLAGYAQDDVTQPAFVDTPPPVAVERPPSGVAGDSLGAATGHILHPPPAYPGRPVANAQAELGNDGEIGLPDHLPDRNCRLLGPFALFVQAVMGVVVVGSLVLKRQGEKPKRPWKIWCVKARGRT